MTCELTLKPNNVTISVEKGTKIIDALNGYASIEIPCGRRGNCGKCKVLAIGDLSPLTYEEKELRENNLLPINYRLACTTEILGNTTVYIEKPFHCQIMEENSIKNIPIKSHIEKIYYPLEFNKIKENYPCEMVNGDPTFVYFNKELIGIEEGDTRGEAYGVAFDIGTTTIVAYLVDLITGKVLSKISDYNPQIIFGDDLISRIDYINKHSVQDLQIPLIRKINELIDYLVGDKLKSLYCGIFAGNTCMNHILLGIDPKTLGVAPYKPTLYDSVIKDGKDLNININGKLLFMPNIESFIGGDTVSLILSEIKDKENVLCVDIGTNGEIVLKHKGKIYVTSTATGPAFEGYNISCGMKGVKGAIDKVYIDNGEIKFSTIGNEKPKGICGSGLVDLISVLVTKKIILPSGKMKENYYLTNDIFLSPKDVREFQMGKASLMSGIKTLMDKVNIDELIISGGFGNYLNIESAINIGMLPQVENIKYVGNGCGSGAIMALINKDYWDYANKIRKDIIHVDLANSVEYKDNLVHCLQF